MLHLSFDCTRTWYNHSLTRSSSYFAHEGLHSTPSSVLILNHNRSLLPPPSSDCSLLHCAPSKSQTHKPLFQCPSLIYFPLVDCYLVFYAMSSTQLRGEEWRTTNAPTLQLIAGNDAPTPADCSIPPSLLHPRWLIVG